LHSISGVCPRAVVNTFNISFEVHNCPFGRISAIISLLHISCAPGEGFRAQKEETVDLASSSIFANWEIRMWGHKL